VTGPHEDGDAEAWEIVAQVVAVRKPEKIWPAPPLRRLLRAEREKALLGAFILGVRDGAVLAQKALAESPNLLARFGEQGPEGAPGPWISGLPFESADFADLSEYMAATERYGAGRAYGWYTLLGERLVRASS